MSLIFDSHAHYDDKAFDEDRNALLDILPQKGVCGVINCSSDLDNVKASISLAKKYKFQDKYFPGGNHDGPASGLIRAIHLLGGQCGLP